MEMLTLKQVSALKTLFFGYFKDFRGFIVWETVDDGSDIGVGISSRFKLWFLGFQRRGVIVQGSVVVLRKFPLPGLVTIAGSMSWLLAVEALSLLHEFLSFRGHGVDVHGIQVSTARRVLISSILFIVLVVSQVSPHSSHESSPVVVKKNGFFVPFVNGFGNAFHGHDSFDQFWFKGFLVEVD